MQLFWEVALARAALVLALAAWLTRGKGQGAPTSPPPVRACEDRHPPAPSTPPRHDH